MELIEKLQKGKGFIAALDQSGGSSKKTLANYGILETNISNDAIMFDYIHEMRKRIIINKSFDERILAVILFQDTMRRKIDERKTSQYLIEEKGIFSFLKIDNGLEEESDGVKLLKDIPNLESLLKEAKENDIIGTKMRSVITKYNEYGIKKVIEQQFKIAKKIIATGLIPIIEPEVSIDALDKKQIETFMRSEILKELAKMKKDEYVIFKFTLPEVPNFYNELLTYKNVLRIVALSGGYSRDIACQKLKENKKMIASFSRALLEGLNVSQTDEEFRETLNNTIEEIYEASIKK